MKRDEERIFCGSVPVWKMRIPNLAKQVLTTTYLNLCTSDVFESDFDDWLCVMLSRSC
jgi:hypothetical protein